MKNLIALVFVLSFSAVADDVCNGHVLSKAQQEAILNGEIEKYQKRTDGLRRFMGDEFTQSQAAARTRTRLFNHLLQNSVDNAKIYNVFMPVFRDVQESYVVIQNLLQRRGELQFLLAQVERGQGLSAENLRYLARIGEEVPAAANQAQHLKRVLAGFETELARRNDVLISNYDEFVSLELSLDNLVKSDQISAADKEHFEHLLSTLRLNLPAVQARPYMFFEQLNQSYMPLVNTQTIKKYVDSNLLLKRDLWRERASRQWSGLYVNILYKLRIHEQVLSFVTKRIPVGSKAFLKKIMGRASKTVIDAHLLNEYGASISSQVEPIMRAQSIERQFENMLMHNQHSERPDEFLVALARSDDGKIAFAELKKYAQEKPVYESVFKAMEKAEKDAAIMGPLKIPERKPSTQKVALLTLTQLAIGVGVLEYTGFIDLLPDKAVDDHVRRMIDVLSDPTKDPKKTQEVLDEVEQTMKAAGAEPDRATSK